jgi:nucleoid DNA-binding protein
MIKTYNLEEIKLKVARELGVSTTTVDNIVKHFYGELRGHLTNPEFDSILIHNLGTFKINQGALRHMIRRRPSIRANKETYKQFIELLKEKYRDEFEME